MLNKYLNDPKKLDRAMNDSPEDHRLGFKLFNLHPKERYIQEELMYPKKKNFHVNKDPYYTKYRKGY